MLLFLALGGLVPLLFPPNCESLWECGMFNTPPPPFKSVASLCFMWSSVVPYLRLLPSTAPSLLSLHPSNDGGIIFLPLIASLLPLSQSNDCSYLISPYPRSLFLSLSRTHYSSHSLPAPPLSPSPSRLRLLSFFFPTVASPSARISVYLHINPANQGHVTVFAFILSCWCVRIKGQLRLQKWILWSVSLL